MGLTKVTSVTCSKFEIRSWVPGIIAVRYEFWIVRLEILLYRAAWGTRTTLRAGCRSQCSIQGWVGHQNSTRSRMLDTTQLAGLCGAPGQHMELCVALSAAPSTVWGTGAAHGARCGALGQHPERGGVWYSMRHPGLGGALEQHTGWGVGHSIVHRAGWGIKIAYGAGCMTKCRA